MEDEPGRAQVLLELLTGHAGLDGGIQVVGADAQDAIHPRHVDRDAAVDRIDVAFERGAGAEGHNRTAVRRAGAHDGLDRLGALGEHDRMRQRRRVM